MTSSSHQRSSWFARLWPLAVLLLVALVLWGDKLALWNEKAQVETVQVNCTTLIEGCSVIVKGQEIRLGLSTAPKPLAPFQIWVKTKNIATNKPADVRKAEVRFIMEGMDMGFNLYTLRADKEGTLRGTVTLPICVTGRRDWAMILDLNGTRIVVPFVTEL